MLKHNIQTLNELNYFISQNQNCCVVNPCGSGKTSVMAELIKTFSDKKFIVFTKQKNAQKYYQERDDVFKKVPVFTYCKMNTDIRRGITEPYKADIYICDEAHYLGATTWRQSFETLRKLYHPVLAGFTATAQRYEQQDTTESIVTDFFDGHSAGNYTAVMLQKKGVFLEPEYILSIWDMPSLIESRLDKLALFPEKEARKYEKKLNEILTHWQKTACPELILQNLQKFMYKPQCNRILVYVSSVAQIDAKDRALTPMIQKIFPDKTIQSYHYSYKDPEENLTAFLKEDKNSFIKILYSVDKIMETVHIPDLRIAIMLRPSVSKRIITQQFGRLNDINAVHKPLIIDMVDNLSNLRLSGFHASDGNADKILKKTGKPADITDLKYITSVKNIFDAIDGETQKIVRYTVGFFTGSLKQICDVYSKDYDRVKALLDENMDIEDAVAKSPSRPVAISQETFDGLIARKDMPPVDTALAESYIPTVQRYIKSHNITDDDLIQEFYIDMMEIISRHKDRLGMRILNKVNNRYLSYAKTRIRREALYEDTFDSLVVPDKLTDYVYSGILWETVEKIANKRLTQRERFVLYHRIIEAENLEDIGLLLNITRERVRQIEAKSLRKLRGIQAIRKLET